MNGNTIITNEDIQGQVSLGDALTLINDVPIHSKYNKFFYMNQMVGRDQTVAWSPLSNMLFTSRTISLIRQKVSEYLIGVDPKGRRIEPTDRVIVMGLNNIFENYRPETGDIYGKYLVVDMEQRNDYSTIVDRTISLLVRGISTDLGMIEQNNKLSIWDTVLGDFNSKGLRAHPQIKTRERRCEPMLFNMHY